jgi:hypothetical protein
MSADRAENRACRALAGRASGRLMSLIEFVTSVMSVAPAALLDYAVIALVLKLPLRLKLVWAVRGFPLALVLMAALRTWQQPIELTGAVCLGAVAVSRLAQAAAAWVLSLRGRPAAVRGAAA